MRFFENILDIIFPKVCCVCSHGLTENEEIICFHCRSELPKTNFSDALENELVNRFYGKLKIDFGISYLYFLKSGITQKLLHQFKYNNYPEIGEMIGRWLGHELLKNNVNDKIDIIIPVPLHLRKERKRGYNQSQYFAKGISEITNIPTEFKTLKRIHYNESQTHKSKEQRWKTVENAFQIVDKKTVKSKSVLLVDDVITTGATIEACGYQILNSGASGLGIASMALAK